MENDEKKKMEEKMNAKSSKGCEKIKEKVKMKLKGKKWRKNGKNIFKKNKNSADNTNEVKGMKNCCKNEEWRKTHQKM